MNNFILKLFSSILPSDAPFRIYLLNCRILSIIICNIRTAKHSPVYMNEDGWTTRNLTRWSPTLDFTSISPVGHRGKGEKMKTMSFAKFKTAGIFSMVIPWYQTNWIFHLYQAGNLFHLRQSIVYFSSSLSVNEARACSL